MREDFEKKNQTKSEIRDQPEEFQAEFKYIIYSYSPWFCVLLVRFESGCALASRTRFTQKFLIESKQPWKRRENNRISNCCINYQCFCGAKYFPSTTKKRGLHPGRLFRTSNSQFKEINFSRKEAALCYARGEFGYVGHDGCL